MNGTVVRLLIDNKPLFLTIYTYVLSPVLSNIFNTSITSGVHPSKFKISQITSIF